MKNYRRLGTAASLGALSLALLAGCGGADGASDAGAIKIMTIGLYDSPALGYAFPEVGKVVEAHFDAVNDAGGINGRNVEVITCNDQGDANVATSCARKAVSEKVVAVVPGFTFFGDQILPVLEQAGIPMVGGSIVTPADGKNPVSFPMDGGIPVSGYATAVAAVDAGCTAGGAIVLGNPAAAALGDIGEEYFKSKGLDFERSSVPATGLPSFNAQVSTLVSAGVECIFPIMDPANTAKALTAISQSGEDPFLATASSQIFSSVVTKLPPEAEGAVITSPFYLPTDTDQPGVEAMIDEIEKYAKGTQLSAQTLPAYVGSKVLTEALSSIDGDITSKTALKAMGSITDFDTGLGPVISTTKSLNVPDNPRLLNAGSVVYKVVNGLPVANGGFTDFADQISK